MTLIIIESRRSLHGSRIVPLDENAHLLRLLVAYSNLFVYFFTATFQ
jgi:hypothetical protein